MNEDPVRWKLYAEATRLWIPVVISLCAISLTIFQAMTTRRHARLSVQPRIEWRIAENAVPGTLDLSLTNVGFGPGVLRDLAFVVDGEPDPRRRPRRLQGALPPHRPQRRDGLGHRLLRQQPRLRAPRPATASRSTPAARSRHSPTRTTAPSSSTTAASPPPPRYCSFYEDCWKLAPD